VSGGEEEGRVVCVVHAAGRAGDGVVKGAGGQWLEELAEVESSEVLEVPEEVERVEMVGVERVEMVGVCVVRTV
jgi:hypothetical protein